MKNKILTSILGILLIVSVLNLISAVSVVNVISNPSEIIPGQIADVSVEIENVFEYDVSNLRVSLDLTNTPFAPYQSSSEIFLDELKDGDEEDFDFQLIVLPDTSSGIYKIPIQINYKNNASENITKNEVISLIVNSQPELRVSLEDSVTIIKGQENKISIRIINSGLADVKFVYLSLGGNGGVQVLSENEQYIGEINSDDFDNVNYRIYVSSGASNNIDIPITLKYRDATNKQFTETKIISMRTYSLKEVQDLGLVKKPSYTIYIVIGLLLVVYIIYKIRKNIKKKRKLKENSRG
jgi:hypothetical protein